MQDREDHPGFQYRLALVMIRNEGFVVLSLVNWKNGNDNRKKGPRPDFSFRHIEFGVLGGHRCQVEIGQADLLLGWRR